MADTADFLATETAEAQVSLTTQYVVLFLSFTGDTPINQRFPHVSFRSLLTRLRFFLFLSPSPFVSFSSRFPSLPLVANADSVSCP